MTFKSMLCPKEDSAGLCTAVLMHVYFLCVLLTHLVLAPPPPPLLSCLNSLRMDINAVDAHLCYLAEPNTVSVFKKSQNPTPAASVKASFAPLAHTHLATHCPHHIRTHTGVRVSLLPPPLSCGLLSPPLLSHPILLRTNQMAPAQDHQVQPINSCWLGTLIQCIIWC